MCGRRAKELESKGIHYVGMGISGGEEGARTGLYIALSILFSILLTTNDMRIIGPSLMPGGPLEAYQLLHPILAVASAQVVALPNPASPTDSGKYLERIFTHNTIILIYTCMHYQEKRKMRPACPILGVLDLEIMSKWSITGTYCFVTSFKML